MVTRKGDIALVMRDKYHFYTCASKQKFVLFIDYFYKFSTIDLTISQADLPIHHLF